MARSRKSPATAGDYLTASMLVDWLIAARVAESKDIERGIAQPGDLPSVIVPFCDDDSLCATFDGELFKVTTFCKPNVRLFEHEDFRLAGAFIAGFIVAVDLHFPKGSNS